MSQDHTIKGERYYDCDLCGFTYRISDTIINSAGLRVCKNHDVDRGEYRFGRSGCQSTIWDRNIPTTWDNRLGHGYTLWMDLEI